MARGLGGGGGIDKSSPEYMLGAAEAEARTLREQVEDWRKRDETERAKAEAAAKAPQPGLGGLGGNQIPQTVGQVEAPFRGDSPDSETSLAYNYKPEQQTRDDVVGRLGLLESADVRGFLANRNSTAANLASLSNAVTFEQPKRDSDTGEIIRNRSGDPEGSGTSVDGLDFMDVTSGKGVSVTAFGANQLRTDFALEALEHACAARATAEVLRVDSKITDGELDEVIGRANRIMQASGEALFDEHTRKIERRNALAQQQGQPGNIQTQKELKFAEDLRAKARMSVANYREAAAKVRFELSDDEQKQLKKVAGSKDGEKLLEAGTVVRIVESRVGGEDTQLDAEGWLARLGREGFTTKESRRILRAWAIGLCATMLTEEAGDNLSIPALEAGAVVGATGYAGLKSVRLAGLMRAWRKIEPTMLKIKKSESVNAQIEDAEATLAEAGENSYVTAEQHREKMNRNYMLRKPKKVKQFKMDKIKKEASKPYRTLRNRIIVKIGSFASIPVLALGGVTAADAGYNTVKAVGGGAANILSVEGGPDSADEGEGTDTQGAEAQTTSSEEEEPTGPQSFECGEQYEEDDCSGIVESDEDYNGWHRPGKEDYSGETAEEDNSGGSS